MREATQDDITADITDAYLRARVVQQRVMWVGALAALIAAGLLATIVMTGHVGPHVTEPGRPEGDGLRHIWSVSSVARR